MFGHFCVLDNVPVFVFVQTVMEWSHIFDPSVTEWPCPVVMCFEITHVHWEYQGPDVVPGQVLAVRLLSPCCAPDSVKIQPILGHLQLYNSVYSFKKCFEYTCARYQFSFLLKAGHYVHFFDVYMRAGSAVIETVIRSCSWAALIQEV